MSKNIIIRYYSSLDYIEYHIIIGWTKTIMRRSAAASLLWSTMLMAALIAGTFAADLPMCSGVGVYLCYDTSNDLCDAYCKQRGSAKASCQIFDGSLRVDCKCVAADVGCLDTSYNSSAIPTCVSFNMGLGVGGAGAGVGVGGALL